MDRSVAAAFTGFGLIISGVIAWYALKDRLAERERADEKSAEEEISEALEEQVPVPAPALAPIWTELDWLVGKQIRDLGDSQKSRAAKLFARVDGIEPPKKPSNPFHNSPKPAWHDGEFSFFAREPWLICDIDRPDGARRRLLVSCQTAFMVASQGKLLVRTLTPEGRVDWGAVLPTGWRSFPSACSPERSPDLRTTLLNVASAASINGRSTRQYYTLTKHGLELVRCAEMSVAGKAIRNAYSQHQFRLGPEPHERTLEQWVMMLGSKRKRRLLVALTWLGGIHLAGKQPDHPQYESQEQAGLVRRVRADPRVNKLIAQMRRSQDRWVREAAELAAKPADRKP